MKYTKEILNIINFSINIAVNENITKKIIIIKPIHIFISIFLTDNFISNLYFISNKNILKLLYKSNYKNINKNIIIFSEEVLNLFKYEHNLKIFTSLNLFINILNLNNNDINKLLNILNISYDNIRNDFINLFLSDNINLDNNLLKYLINLEYKLKKNKNKFIKIINNKLIENILNINNLFLTGHKGIGKRSIIYNYIIENLIFNKYNCLELNTSKLLLEKKSLFNIENYLYKLFKKINNSKNKYFILIPDVNSIVIENNNYNNSIDNLFKFFSNSCKNIKFIFTSTEENYSNLIKHNNSFFKSNTYNLKINEPNINIIKNIVHFNVNIYKKKYNLDLDINLLNNIVDLFCNYSSINKNPLNLLKFIDSLFNNKIKKNFIINNKKNKIKDIKYYKILYNYLLLKWRKKIINFNNYRIKLVNNTDKINLYNNFKINNIYLYDKLNFNVIKYTNKISIEDVLNILPLFINLPSDVLKNKLIKTINIKNKLNDYLKLQKKIKNRIFGQENAVEQILNSIKKNKLGLKSFNKPIGSYIFAGLSGTGKTELVKSLAEGLFGNEKNMIRFDMSEFMEKHSLSRLIGSPPGYIGHEEGGQLTNSVLKNPYSIILLDEIEKAHPDITNILLQLLDDGRLTDTKGNLIDFTNTIIVLTTNLGSPKNLLEYPFLKNTGKLTKEEFNKFILKTNESIEKFFKPEFLNRLDSIIVFKPLGIKELKNIMFKFINDFNLKLKNNSFPVSFYLDKNFIELILKISYKPLYGARPLKRIIEKIIEKPINELLLYFNINKKILIYFYINILTNKPSMCLLKN